MGKKKRKSNKISANGTMRPKPLAPPPEMRSRKRARKVTTLFHALTRKVHEAKREGNDAVVADTERQIAEMGGREEYQRASRLSTSYHSTSRWVLSVLTRRAWLPLGIPLMNEKISTHQVKDEDCDSKDAKDKRMRRTVKLLEIGAINTELLDAASKYERLLGGKTVGAHRSNTLHASKYNDKRSHDKIEPPLSVRAIDINSMDERIEERDFLQIIPDQSHDVVVCSMVLNCVPNPIDRGKMLRLIYQQLCPGGLCFLTIPKLCINQSKYMEGSQDFEALLVNGVGFELLEKKESPKVAFWVLGRHLDSLDSNVSLQQIARTTDSKHVKSKFKMKTWERLELVNKGKSFRNEFGVILSKEYD
mmetsp:Transcript_564/g.926  ORF Transcript_564/g.926 Transcript_564/m.926 type:complete len:362 (-) Transcript_564:66-1151(-)